MKKQFKTISLQVEVIKAIREIKVKGEFHSLGEVVKFALTKVTGDKNSIRRSKRQNSKI